jgi:hypothetical protein
MLRCEYLVVGDNYFGLDAALTLANGGSSVVYATSRIGDELDDCLIYGQFLRDYLITHDKFVLTDFRAHLNVAKEKLQKKINHLVNYQSLTILKGQPEFSALDTAGVHTMDNQTLVKFKNCIYAPSARNYINNPKVTIPTLDIGLENIFDHMDSKLITLYTDKICDFQLALDLSKIGIKINLITNQICIDSYQIKEIKNDNINLINESDILNVNEEFIVYKDSKIKIGKFFYNYNSLVNHYYYRLNEGLVNSITIFGDSLNQSIESYKINFKEKYQSTLWNKIYDQKEYDINQLVGNKTIVQYLVRSRLDEVYNSKSIQSKHLNGEIALDKKLNVLGYRIIGDHDKASYFINKLGSDLKLKDLELFML